MDLFTHAMNDRMRSEAPLAARMRPRSLDEYIGQEHILGPGKLLRRAIEADRLFASIILWGPPGTGKTTLAMCIANQTKSDFVTLSAVMAGKAELREVIEHALERRKLYGAKTILFVKHLIGCQEQCTRCGPLERGSSFISGHPAPAHLYHW